MPVWNYVWGAVSTHPFNAITLLIAALTILYVRRQANEGTRSRELTERTLQLQAEALKSQGEQGAEALNATRLSADASRQSADTAARAFSMQGPMLIVQEHHGRVNHNVGTDRDLTNFILTIILKNIGGSAAFDVTVSQSAVFAKDFPLPSTPDTKFPTKFLGTIGPSSPTELPTSFTFGKREVWERIADGQFVFIEGEATYEDKVNDVIRICPWRFVYNGRSHETYVMTPTGNTPYYRPINKPVVGESDIPQI